MHPEKIRRLAQMPARERYGYFVRKVVDTQQVWGLYRDGWTTMLSHGQTAVPFWPEAAFALICATGDWTAYQPRAIALDDFSGKWLHGMANNNELVCVFPMPDVTATVAAPATLLEELKDEAEQYE